MSNVISVWDLKKEVSGCSSFSLRLDECFESAEIVMNYDRIYVCTSPFTLIVLNNDMGRTALKHICSVRKESSENTDLAYIINCRKLLDSGTYTYTDYFLECFKD